MASSYPNTIEAFIALSGTSKLSSPDHTVEHTLERDNIVAIETVVGTTAGTNVLKNFAAGDFPVRINASNVLQQALTGTASITAGTLSGVLIGTSTIVGGTANAVTLGTPTIGDFTNATHTHATNAQGGTVSHTALSDKGTATHTQIDSHLGATGTAVHGLGNMSLQNSDAIAVTGGTISGALIGTSQITGGSIASAVVGTPTITGGSWSTGTITSSVLGTPTVTGGSWSTGTITASTLGTPTVTGGSWSTGTIANAVVGSPSVTGGTIANALLGTSTITGGTASAIKITSGTLSGVLVGTSTITGGTASAMLLGTSTITGGTISGALIGTSQITGGSISTATIGTPTIIGGTMGTSTVTGGTINTATIGTPNITGGTATLLTPVDVLPVDLKLSTASKGGVFNGGFELGTVDTPVTASGWIVDEKYGWYFYEDGNQASAEFDSAVSYSGKASLKISTLDATGQGRVFSTPVGDANRFSKYATPVKANTLYKLSCWVKTNNVAANAAYIALNILNSAFAYTQPDNNSSKLSGTNDWTFLTVSLTTGATAAVAEYLCANKVAGNTGDAWFDDIKLEEVVTDTTFTGKTVEKIRPVLTAVTSTDNIDQSLDTGGAYANTYALTNAVNEGATHRQTFTPTKKYTTQVGVWVVAKGTGNWTMAVHDSSNVIIARVAIVNASLTDGAFNYFNVPNIWVSGALHFHVYSSVADGTLKANTTDDLETASYIQRYAKKSETYSLVVNGIKTEMKADKDGLLTGSVIDLDNGKYVYGYDSNLITTALINAFSNDIFSAEAGGMTNIGLAINGWRTDASALGGATGKSFVLKVNTILPIKHLAVKWKAGITGNQAVNRDVMISLDNVTYKAFSSSSVAGPVSIIEETDYANGVNVVYLKVFDNSAAEAYLYTLAIYADLDTSKLPTGLFYPIGTNQFTETVTLPSVATRAYFRLAKFTNEYGVIVPAIEFTDTTPTTIGYIPLKLDNSQETNPSIRVLSTTTNYQVSGTGSSDSGYVLNDGEYITLSTAIASIKIDYQVGKGTTAFTNITKNTIYYSSNGEGNDSTQDPSHQMSVDLGIRQQGALQRITDIGEELQKVRDGVLKTSSWTDWTPTLTWTTGTPEGSVVTKARYKILDGVCYFAFYYSATDANGATALTISLPVLPKDNDSLTALQSQELADTTWSDPIAYIDDGGTTIVFRSFATIADTKAVKVLVSGWYEI